MFSKCSTKCLIAFTICAIALVVLSSIFMAIVTTSVLVRSSTHPSSGLLSHRELLRKNIEKYLMGSEPPPNGDPNSARHDQPGVGMIVGGGDQNAERMPQQPNGGGGTGDVVESGAGGKLAERNVFSWITDTIKKSFMSNGDAKSGGIHSQPTSFASLFDLNGEMMANSNDFNNLAGINGNYDQILELTKHFHQDG